ncbi:MAG: DUF559 domain-containing protein [Dehalococcoidia bacterium]
MKGKDGSPAAPSGRFYSRGAREMRREPTEAEAALWALLRNRQLAFKFKRQELRGTYIVDFYCAAKSGWLSR